MPETNPTTDPVSTSWRIDKRIPLALLFGILLQTAMAFWWASSISERVSVLERQMAATAPQADRLTRVEVKIESIQQGIAEIKRLIVRPARLPAEP